ncbi:MAG TPA: LON peptidase substrate-binding domain-containing protein [Streptosporangiaceae bacterium]|nr:LON peptidase substrate-binding domain-containing protein [Streptosporangiaceae bacterium]
MSEMLPLFPLGTVLYPGLLLPLHIFEERYRQLVRDLLADGEAPRFGVVAIREGRETGVSGVSALYPVGCTAVLRQVQQYPDGRYDIVTVGVQRFRLLAVDESQPYLRGEVELLPEEAGDPAAAQLAARAVRPAFSDYLRALASLAQHDPQQAGVTEGAAQAADERAAGNGGQEEPGDVPSPDLPAAPVALSYVIAALMVVDLPDKQALLAEPDAVGRLAAERAMLAKETGMLRSLTSAPAPELRYSPYSNN